MPAPVEDRLRAYCELLDDVAEEQLETVARQDSSGPPQRRARSVRIGLLVAAAAVVISGVVVVARQGHEQSVRSGASAPETTTTLGATTASPSPSSTSTAPTISDAGTWTPIAESPLGPREDASVVWTGTEFIVWGGHQGMMALTDGAAYNPSTDTWRKIASNQWGHPGATATYDGSNMIVLAKAGGASYDIAANTWTDLPDAAYETNQQLFAAAMWNGTEILGVGARSVDGNEVVAAASLARGGDQFALLAPSPMPWVDGVEFAQTPGGFVAWYWAGDARQTWLYERPNDSWTELPPFHLPVGYDVINSHLVDGSDGELVVADVSTPSGPRSLLLDISTGQYIAYLDSPVVTTTAILVGRQMLVLGTNDGRPVRAVVDRDRPDATAMLFPPPDATIGAQAIAVGDGAVFVWSGESGDGVRGDGEIWRPVVTEQPPDEGCLEQRGTQTMSPTKWYHDGAPGGLTYAPATSYVDVSPALDAFLEQLLPDHSLVSSAEVHDRDALCTFTRVVVMGAADGSTVQVRVWRPTGPTDLDMSIRPGSPFVFDGTDQFVSVNDDRGNRALVKVLPDGLTIMVVAVGPYGDGVHGPTTTVRPGTPGFLPAPEPPQQTIEDLSALATAIAASSMPTR